MNATAWLWAGVVAMGVYHGVSPAMGWPLAVANALTERRASALLAAIALLALGHLLAIALVLLPFALLAWVVQWQREIRVAAGALVVAFGAWRWFHRRHPRALARVKPTRLALWSFLMATAHGAALMLLPLTMGLCGAPGTGLEAAALARSTMVVATAVTLVHTLATMLTGLVLAWLVYRLLGVQFVKRSWFDLDAVWAASLVIAGGTALAMALRAP